LALGPGEIRIIKDALSDSTLVGSIVIGVAGLVATAVLAYLPAWAPLWRAHGYFVAALALYLLYSARHDLSRTRAEPMPWALLLLVPIGICALWAARSQIPALQLLLLPPLLLIAVLAAFGARVARLALVPVAFIYFAAPVWNLVLTGPLQALTTQVTAVLAPALGLPVTFVGNTISFPGGATFTVTEACSGATFLVQGLAVATLLGEVEHASFARRVRLLLSMIPVALLANWTRVLLILALGYATDMRSPLATRDHVMFGFAIFFVVLALYVWAATRKPLPAMDTEAKGVPADWRPQPSYFLVIAVLVLVALSFAGITPANHYPTPGASAHSAMSPDGLL
jgi:exosortase